MANVLIERPTLSSIANAIRNKNQSTVSYTVSQMASAINAFEKTGFNLDDVAVGNVTGNLSGSATSIASFAFVNNSGITGISFPSCVSVYNSAFLNCQNITNVSLPICTLISFGAFSSCYKLSSIYAPKCISIGSAAFYYCSSITNVSFPSCTSVWANAFQNCYKLSSINIPLLDHTGTYAFASCSSMFYASFPILKSLSGWAFYRCPSLQTLYLGQCTDIGQSAFTSCYNLTALYLNDVSSVTSLGTGVFTSTPIGGYSTSAGQYGSVFVPTSLVASFKTATNWTAVSDRIVGCNTITSNSYYYSNDFTSNGLTFSTDTTTGIVTVNGTATGTVGFRIADSWSSYGGGMQLFCCPPGGSTTTYYAYLCTDVYDHSSYYYDYGSGVYSGACTADNEAYMNFVSGQTFSNFKFKPILINIPS